MTGPEQWRHRILLRDPPGPRLHAQAVEQGRPGVRERGREVEQVRSTGPAEHVDVHPRTGLGRQSARLSPFFSRR